MEGDIEYAAELVREGYATVEQAALACGIALDTLQAHLEGREQSEDKEQPNARAFEGSSSASGAGVQNDGGGTDAHTLPTSPRVPGSTATVETTDYFVFYREENRWVWKRVDQDGKVVKSSHDFFRYYLDCVADARPHGFNGRPLFIFAASDIASLNAPDKKS